MTEHTCEAVVVHCIDFRLQSYLNDWLTNRFGKQNYDRVSWAGAVKDFFYIQGQIEISRRLHKINRVVLINHEDCGAYGVGATKERHVADLAYAERMIKIQFVGLLVEKYYLRLDGTFELLPAA